MADRVPFDVAAVRQQFPALVRVRNGRTPLFLDGPGGTQTPRVVINAVAGYLSSCNANQGGVFTTSRESDRIVEDARLAMADFLNARAPEEIIFGQNMTSLAFHLSRSLAKTWKPGDEILVTRLDHDANVSPWTLAARDAGATVKFVEVRTPECTLDLEDFRRQLSSRTKFVAVGCASNAVGTINDVRTLATLAHERGAWIFLDAVHYAPHGPIDVQAWDCDFLACSAYKFFGPHVGILCGRREILSELPAYKVRPAPTGLPGSWMTGTQNHEGLAGAAAAMRYLAGLGSPTGAPAAEPGTSTFRSQLRAAMTRIQEYEQGLVRRLLTGLERLRTFQVWGIRDANRLAERVPTVAITLPDKPASLLARFLADREIYAWSGNMYAQNLSERLGLEDRGGFLRLGMVHYNTEEEVDETLRALADFKA